MIYRVKNEIGYKGTETVYKINQRITEGDIANIMNRFNGKPYDRSDDKKITELKFYDRDIFGRKSLIYDITLAKVQC